MEPLNASDNLLTSTRVHIDKGAGYPVICSFQDWICTGIFISSQISLQEIVQVRFT